MEMLKVSTNSEPGKIAGAITHQFNNGSKKVEIQAIGAGAVNQALKGIIIARGYMAPTGRDLICTPAFCNVDVEGDTRTGIKFIIKDSYDEI